MRRKLNRMPYDHVFWTDRGEEMCHATGWEECHGDPKNPADWWNEYEDADGGLHYGR